MHTINRLELEKLHRQLMGMCVIKPTNPFYWINTCLILCSIAGCFVGFIWFVDALLGSSMLVGFASLNFIQAGILVFFPILVMLIVIEIMRIIVKLRVLRFLRTEKPEIRMLERLLDARLVSGLSVATNCAIEEYISSQEIKM